ncbi:MAG TPA: hypothetical protein VD761_04850 [Solirubrobacterales bacterium]|nr:hypothetical protein [Solirubrobacterales bacterium]
MSERSLASYLLLPRPGDLVKAWIFPAAFAFGALAGGGVGGRELLRAAIAWVALEFLIYQARYQWNDIRGFDADQRHPDRVARGRLPGPASRRRQRVNASGLVLLIRLALVALVAVVLAPLDLGAPLLALALAVFGVAIVYEWVRGRCAGSAEGVPPSITPAILALWAVVGAGYAVRGVSGLALAVDVFGQPWLLAAAVATFWSFGVAFVTGRWALEALPFGRCDGRGGILWRVEAGQAREHSLALVRWLPTAPANGRQDERFDDWHALAGEVPPLAPWNLAAVLAAAAAALTGRLLAGPADPLEAVLATAAGALCAAAALVPSWRRYGLAIGSLALFALMAAAGSPRPALVAIPWLCILGAHLFFTAQSPRTLAHPLRFALVGARSRLAGPRQRLAVSPAGRR